MIRSQSLLVNSSLNFGDIWTTYKLRQGQSALTRAIFDEAVDFNLEYAFNTKVTSIAEDTNSKQGSITVTTAKGESFIARRVVCTVPLNVLKTIHFSPPLSPKRQEAINIGHVNFMSKIHAVVEGSELTSWSGMQMPGHLLFGYGDGVTPKGDAHLVGFGADERAGFVPEKEPEKVVAAFNALHPMKLKKTVSPIL
jgi:monoamine oxidase